MRTYLWGALLLLAIPFLGFGQAYRARTAPRTRIKSFNQTSINTTPRLTLPSALPALETPSTLEREYPMESQTNVVATPDTYNEEDDSQVKAGAGSGDLGGEADGDDGSDSPDCGEGSHNRITEGCEYEAETQDPLDASEGTGDYEVYTEDEEKTVDDLEPAGTPNSDPSWGILAGIIIALVVWPIAKIATKKG